MPKAVLEFQLPEEQTEFEFAAIKGEKYFLVLCEFAEWLRGQIKYIEPENQADIHRIWDRLFECLNEEGVMIP